ncbi:hypothetical protein [Burkholderia ambifaria]|uniref:hypothetical protein n=1 Tax=Burkholderia ambifaria TaxID=152480 RepID=UPI00158EA84D|nr:hypothetical protein [Burkholderia ambifaria]
MRPDLADTGKSKFRASGNRIEILNNDGKICVLDQQATTAVESFDGSAVIISERGYVKKDDLDHCVPNVMVHVYTIPRNVGVLADINLDAELYVAIDFVTVRPMKYLATVARLDSVKNLVTINGAYLDGQSLSKLQRYAFGSSGEAGSAVISPDGRYVAPAGQIDCNEDASPGVWDIERNIKVIADEQSCNKLFSLTGNGED